MTYAQLVEEAKKEVASRKDYGKSLNYERCKLWEDGDQINLWTYWQGYQIKDVEEGVDILLVG